VKAWSVAELDNVVASLRPLVGARLQEVQTLGSDIALGFYTNQRLLWLWIDLNAIRPALLPWTDLPKPLSNKKTPVHLFLKAHFRNRALLAVTRDEALGRVVRLQFSDGDQLEIRLLPHGANFLAKAGDKSISWAKPGEMSGPVPSPMPGKIRGLEDLREEWLQIRGQKGSRKEMKSDPAQKMRGELERKRKGLAKVEEELQRKKDMPWREVGAWLKQNQSLDVPAQWNPFVDKRRKLSWNIEQAFNKAREVEGKVFGTEQRRALLLKDIERLEHDLAKPPGQMLLKAEKPAFQPLRESQAEGRTLRINEELIAVAGRNAADNLKLLRKARAWDFWIHIQDRPGAHVILFRNKSTSVSDAVLRQVMEWFVRMQLGAKLAKHGGEKWKFLVAECRHVRPIKGDKLGRVHYQDERVLIYQVPH
jgi:predicted ribosome quality control (RQC) complex YloA/Tae2 family protein